MQCAYIGLGSNLNNPLEQVKKALKSINHLPFSTIVQTSSFYFTQPWGVTDQPAFVNCVVAVKTQLSPVDLLHSLLQIEDQQGRVREVRYGPRTIDLDILLYGKEIILSSELEIPHPRMLERDFVLYPLIEIAPDLLLPNGDLLMKYKTICPDRGICLMEEKECSA